MNDKVQKIRKEVEKLKSQLIRGACSSQVVMETRCKEEAYNEVLTLLDTMQEEPVSEDLKKELDVYLQENFTIEKDVLDKFGIEEEDYMYSMDKHDILKMLSHFVKEEPVSKELLKASMEFAKYFGEWDYAMLCFQAGANWREEQMMANAVDGAFIRRNRYTNKNVLNGLDTTCDAIQGFKDKDRIKVLFIKED